MILPSTYIHPDLPGEILLVLAAVGVFLAIIIGIVESRNGHK